MSSDSLTLVIDPDLPGRWLEEAASGAEVGRSDPVFSRFDSPPRGGITAWYTMCSTALADGREDEMSSDLDAAVVAYEQRGAARRDLCKSTAELAFLSVWTARADRSC